MVEHLEGVFSKRNSPNQLKVSMPLGAEPWLADVNNLLYKAARRAIKTGVFLFFFLQFLVCFQVCQGIVLNNTAKQISQFSAAASYPLNLVDFDRTTHQHIPYLAKF